MIFYLLGLCLFIIFGFGYSKDKYNYINLLSITLLYLFFVFIFTFRCKSVGTDTNGYILNYKNGYKISIEPLFYFLNYGLKLLHLSYFSLFIIISSTIFILFLKSFERNEMFILLPLIYIIMLIPSLNIQRQILGLAFAFYGIKKNNRNSILYFIIGFLFHKSIIFYLLIFFISRFLKLNQKIYYFSGIILLFLFLSGKLLDILLLLMSYTPYAEYRWIIFSKATVSVSIITFVKIILYYFFFFYSDEIIDTKKRSLYNILVCCLLVSEMAVKMNPIFFRLQVLFSPTVLFGVQTILNKIKNNNNVIHKVYLGILLLYTVFTFYLNLKMGVNQIIPFGFTDCYEI